MCTGARTPVHYDQTVGERHGVEGPTLALTMSSAGDRAKAPDAIIADSHPRAVVDIALHVSVMGRHLMQDTGEGWGDGKPRMVVTAGVAGKAGGRWGRLGQRARARFMNIG
jgi:hypothetical protein